MRHNHSPPHAANFSGNLSTMNAGTTCAVGGLTNGNALATGAR